MSSNPKAKSLTFILQATAFILLATLAPISSVYAGPAIFWTGPNTNYNQSPLPTFSTAGGQDVLIPGAVALNRKTRDRMYNGIMEASHTAGVSPSDTEWATATPAVIADLTKATTLTYSSFDGWVGPHFGFATVQGFIVGRAAVVHLVSENIYISIKFSAWTAGGAGFAYTRSTAAAVAPSPMVSITNPADGAIFSAPANVSIGANATVSSGTVTNVAFFAGTNALGAATAAPFGITASNLAAGAYALTAVATAAGVSSTSAIVNITVVSPTPTVSITNPADGAVFAAPANVTVKTSATVSSGTVTNVTCFAGTNVLGSATVAPFSVVASNLAAGAYALTAVATAAGVSSTSAVVHISVVTPVAISNSSPTVSNGLFTFSYTANPGLTYVVQRSPDLTTWSPVVTNVPVSSPVQVSDTFVPTGSHYYRVGLVPNP